MRRSQAHRPTLAERGVLSTGELAAATPVAALALVVGWAGLCLALIALS